MKWSAISLALCVTVASSGCWRPYYGQTYATPAYPQPPIVNSTPAVQTVPIVQQAPVYQQQPVVYQQPMYQQNCQPVVCQPNPCCQSY